MMMMIGGSCLNDRASVQFDQKMSCGGGEDERRRKRERDECADLDDETMSSSANK